MLTDRYLDAIPADSRAARGTSLSTDLITEDTLRHVRALNEIATKRGQSLAQMAIAWVLRGGRVTSALIGASSVEQLQANVAAVDNLEFTDDELAAIDQNAVDAGINLWEKSSANYPTSSVQRAEEAPDVLDEIRHLKAGEVSSTGAATRLNTC